MAPPRALNDLEKEGAVRRFGHTVELGWKVLNDFPESSGVQLPLVTPRSVVEVAFASRVLADGQRWIDMLDHRTALSYEYDPGLLAPALEVIRARYLPALEELRSYLGEQPV